jgi:hypothetical protein
MSRRPLGTTPQLSFLEGEGAMKHRRSAPHVAFRSRGALGLALFSLITGGVAIGGCPGPDPRTIASGGASSSVTSASSSEGGGRTTGSGGDVAASGSGGKGGGMPTLDGGCDSGMNPCCADLTSDPSNCGQCGYVCALDNASGTSCVAGKCKPVCLAGYADLKHQQQTDDGCETQARRVFVTKNPVLMPISGGLAGADTICTMEAHAPGGPGNTFAWRAWLSDSTVVKSPKQWTNVWQNAYVLVDNTTAVAKNFSDFFAGANTSLLNAIDKDSVGALVTSGMTWTGTDATGAPTTHDCLGWTSPNGGANSPTVGATNHADAGWTDNPSVASCAATTVRLFCFEMATSG